MWTVLERWRDFGSVLNESLLPVIFFQILVERLADSLAVGNFAFLQTDNCFDRLLRKDRVTFNLQIAKAVKSAVNDRHRDAQGIVN